MIKAIEPQNWSNFLADFSERNRNRRARFELFGRGGVEEEEQEAHFESVAIEVNKITIKRIDKTNEEDRVTIDKLPNIHGIAVQYDTDGSEDMLEFTDDNNNLAVLHFESLVDGDS